MYPQNSHRQLDLYQKNHNNKSFQAALIESLCLNGQQQPAILIDYYGKSDKMERFLGRTHLIMGPRGSGKSSFVYNALEKQTQTKIITIDCRFDIKPENIVTSMIEKLSPYFTMKQEKLQKTMIFDDHLELGGLDEYLKKKTFSFVFLIRNAERLVANKRQLILYNFFEWIKRWQQQKKIGLILCTCDLDFMNKLEKRVKSRLSHTIINLMPMHGNIESPKAMICSRLLHAKIPKGTKDLLGKFIQCITKNDKLDALLLVSSKSPCRRPSFYLQIFKMIIAIKFNSYSIKQLNQMSCQQIRKKLQEGFKLAHPHMPTLVDKIAQNLKSMNYPEYFVMGIIRKLMLDNKPSIRLKQIINQYTQYRIKMKDNPSFRFPDQMIERAVRNLVKFRILSMDKKQNSLNDFKNAQIWSELAPDTISEVICSIQNSPQLLKQLAD